MTFDSGNNRQSDQDGQKTRPGRSIAFGIPIGVGFGVALGLVLDNLALGIAIGAALGIAIGAGLGQRRQNLDDNQQGKQRTQLLILVALGVLVFLLGAAVFVFLLLK